MRTNEDLCWAVPSLSIYLTGIQNSSQHLEAIIPTNLFNVTNCMRVALITNNTKNKKYTSHAFCPFLFKWDFRVNTQNGYNLNIKP